MKSSMLVMTSLIAGLAMFAYVWGAGESPSTREGKTMRTHKVTRWKLGTQAWTFHTNTLFEAIDKTKELHLKYMEFFPGQSLSPDQKEVKFNESAPQELIDKVKEKLKAVGIEFIAYGVTRMGENEADARKVFEFARKMGVTTITAEPSPESMKMIDKLANEYQINVAIHNHPKPSHYWNPEAVLKAVEGCSKRIGSCADTGHWTRSGLNPLECLKKLEGRVVSCHFKDLNEKSAKAHDVIWGTGVSDCKALLAELKRQGFVGPMMIEYEHNWDKSMPEIAKCVEFFKKMVKEMGGRMGGRSHKKGEKKE